MKNQVKCKICGKEHALGGCPDFKSMKSLGDGDTAIGTGKAVVSAVKGTGTPRSGVTDGETSTPPKPKMGRPRTGYIKSEYNRLYSADKRKADKLGLKVSEYRKMKGNE